MTAIPDRPNESCRQPIFVDELGTEDLQQLQYDTAVAYGVQPLFHDTLQNGHAATPLAVIPAGRYEMGSNKEEFGHRAEEAPQHLVSLHHAFAIGVHSVTADEFERFRADTEWFLRPELIWHTGQYPVINIRMEDIKLYLQWLSDQTGQHYRLPSEAEWEYAARAGSTTPFHQGEYVSCKDIHFHPAFPYQEAKEKRKWYLPRCMPSAKAGEVGMYTPNTWGLHDMHGNVWEFTNSHWTPSHLNANRDGSASTSADPFRYVTKGGSWFDPAVQARSAARKKRFLDEMDTNLGFRVVREL